MFTRKIIQDLHEWQKKKDRKPLIIRGARQVGKTIGVQIFSKYFENYIYLNLDKPEDIDVFQHNLNVKELIQAIFLMKNINPSEGKTLIFIDEIQNSPEAASMLRYFYEETPEYFVIAAGSMLEIMMENNRISFPVGRVEYLFMYPLSFSEFLQASDEQEALKIYSKVPSPEFAHPKLMKLFHIYTMIGGMPEIIEKYIIHRNIKKLQPIYQSLMTSYLDDVSKYARNSAAIPIIQHAIEAAPLEAGKRIKFAGFGNSNYRSREMGEVLKTLERAMLIYINYPTTSIKPPAQPNLRKSPRLQFLDTGLLNFQAGMQSQFYKHENLHSFYKGILAEHIANQEFIAAENHTNRKPLFWVRDKHQSTAELDYLLPFQDLLIPVEIKSGASGSLRSLHQFIESSEHPYAIRLYAGKLEIYETQTPQGKPYKLLNLPYAFAGKIREYAEWFLLD